MLTSIVWWFEVRWNKGTLFVFFFFSFLVPIFFGFPLSFVYLLESNNTNISDFFILLFAVPCIFGANFLAVSFVTSMLHYSDEKINVFKQVQYSPNPNRHNGWLRKARLMVFVEVLSGLFVVLEHKDRDLSGLLGTMFFMCIINIASCYTLCVDPISPVEKKRRIERNEAKNL